MEKDGSNFLVDLTVSLKVEDVLTWLKKCDKYWTGILETCVDTKIVFFQKAFWTLIPLKEMSKIQQFLETDLKNALSEEGQEAKRLHIQVQVGFKTLMPSDEWTNEQEQLQHAS